MRKWLKQDMVKKIIFDRGDRIIIDGPYYSTLDLDYIDKHKLARIVTKIFTCEYSETIRVRDTWKGYHIIITCSKPCEKCRIVFDDQTRFAADQNRKPYLQNILWTRKEARRLCEILRKQN